jgi:ATP-dependent DNA helicase UvrD/PcrA
VNDVDAWDTDTDKATLMTLHAAKGLEFPVVFIVAVEEGVLPHERVGRHPDELEEERRLAFVGITRAKEELQLSYAVIRDFRGQRRHTVPSSFLMEVPRGEMELRDEAEQFVNLIHQDWPDGDEVDDEEDDDSLVEWDVLDVSVEAAEPGNSPSFGVAAAAITTAAALHRETLDEEDTRAKKKPAARVPAVDPDLFKQGMTVAHPEYGPGKIVALSGAGKNRRATVSFARVGQKKFILVHSPLRPAR